MSEKTIEQEEKEWFDDVKTAVETTVRQYDKSIKFASETDDPSVAVKELVIANKCLRELMGLFGMLTKRESDEHSFFLQSCGAETHILSEILIRNGFTTPEELLNMKKKMFEGEQKDG